MISVFMTNIIDLLTLLNITGLVLSGDIFEDQARYVSNCTCSVESHLEQPETVPRHNYTYAVGFITKKLYPYNILIEIKIFKRGYKIS